MENEEVRRIGEQLALGALVAIAKWFLITIVVIAVARCALPDQRDATDAPSGPRSGLMPRIDHGTGCQYLETKNGALLPRMGWNGRHICEATE